MEQTTVAGQVPAETARSPLEWLGLVAPVVALLVAIVFLSNTDWYSVFKAIHVLGAVLWVGGGAAITILALQAQRTKDNTGLVRIAKQVDEKGPDHLETIARVNRIVAVARTDVVLIALIAADMVAKPFS